MANSTTTTSGWVKEPDGRGTWGILSTCLLTITLCCWTSVCPNIPAKSDGYWPRLRDKFHLACMGILGPEFLLMLATGQWSSARKSVKEFSRLDRNGGKGEWTMTHAFYADMGGFLLEGPGVKTPFPVDATQLLFLVKQGYVEYPKITRDDIDDRNKSDGFARFIAVCQVVWFLLNCILRRAQHLALTTLELTTISFVIVFFATSFCWYYKPQDITSTITVTLAVDISTIREKHCPPELEEWHTNPLEFLHPDLYICHVFWRYFNQILRRIHCPIFSRPVTTKPYNRIPSDDFPHLDTLADALACPIVLLFGGMFMFAWSFDFPSSLERILWRLASCYTLLFSIVGGPYLQFCYKVLLPRHAEKRWAGDVEATIPQTRMQRLATKMRNIHPSRDPRLEIPLLAFIPVTVLCALYCISRAYILVEDLVGLRDLPESAFQTVEWSVYIPHL
ncbi:hypothetical protein CNMCM6805_009645 [Aspergillus fumigatiaffinis]|uniref:Uncharacterized protein n=1 Tax=Aspergillus fumigatiaffinis TaxID=340414 RepID=A0A8H4GJ24_9EURO|nr:hypothetical protein CNMCM6457_000918 [Aspergillus fumigatiaffinis]KAF4232837.1 hypothetical protein CNMCM6805_009645 [Aspergillus fumigatiaffinis]